LLKFCLDAGALMFSVRRLLLEAGAVCSGGLRTVTTRHLALAHRSLRLLRALLPHVLRRFLRCAVKPATATKTIAQVSYSGHHSTIIIHPSCSSCMLRRCLYHFVILEIIIFPSIASLCQPLLLITSSLQLERELGEHCAAIEDKIVGVAAPQAGRCLGEWVARSPVPSPSITSLLRVLTRLHQALATVLTHRQVGSYCLITWHTE
jgi:hypothetical protein